MQPRESITNLAITCAVILAVAVLALILKAGRPAPVAIPVAVSPVVKEEKTIDVQTVSEVPSRSLIS